ncbi:ST3GAL6 isoform 8 [Pan troglodytes]|uniref:ST3GAL6 isoform 8 n=1 Tax=Pan troglodytes TaxID=9598 RepID=A0A2J8MXZ3_PANTR|nr:ST3GAL6 isoform 8 [Pan troglodytes]
MRQAPRERQQPAGAAAPQVAEPGAPLRSSLLGLGGSLLPAGFAAGLHCAAFASEEAAQPRVLDNF